MVVEGSVFKKHSHSDYYMVHLDGFVKGTITGYSHICDCNRHNVEIVDTIPYGRIA